MKNKLAVAETFYSIQGEGISTGYPAVFLRLAGCNLMCGGMGTQFDKKLHNGATWRCDTIEVWMKGQSKEYDKILNEESIEALKNGARLVVTGGEPCMQQESLMRFFNWLDKEISSSVYIECETNGTLLATDLAKRVNQFNCSPKLSNSGNLKEARFNPEAIRFLNKQNTIFKFVISRNKDWEEIKEDYLPIIDKDKIWLMPAGSSQKSLDKNKVVVADLCKKYYLKYTGRLQIEIWNQATGV